MNLDMSAAMREAGSIAAQEDKPGQLLGQGALNYAERGAKQR
tara:strand:+ start:626 stop:751 length:126 start_codon:yes stop_codon:yes gene_type:complete